MATISARIYKHHKKADGTYNVKICVHHKNQRKYIDTAHYVVKKQLTTKMKIKDTFINDLVEDQLRGCRRIISDLGEWLDYFKRETVSITEINSNMLVSYERFLPQRCSLIVPASLNRLLCRFLIHKKY